jgi:Double zinc ribbon
LAETTTETAEVICSHCSALLTSEAVYCGYCGTALRSGEPAVEDSLACGKCAKEVLQDSLFCGYCGAAIADERKAEPIAPLRSVPAAARVESRPEPRSLPAVAPRSATSTGKILLGVAAAVVLVLLGWGIGVVSRKPGENSSQQSAAPAQPASSDAAAPDTAAAPPSAPAPVPEAKVDSSSDQDAAQQNTIQQNTVEQSTAQSETQPPAENQEADVAAAKAEPKTRLLKAAKAAPTSPQPSGGQLSNSQLRSSGGAPAMLSPVSARAPSFSGNWHGEYTNYDKNQTTPVKLQIASENDRADQLSGTLSGTLMFGVEGSSSNSCALSGVYNSQTKFMLLSVSNCQGNAPTNLQGRFGFSSVMPADVQAFGMDSAHNGLLNISR